MKTKCVETFYRLRHHTTHHQLLASPRSWRSEETSFTWNGRNQRVTVDLEYKVIYHLNLTTRHHLCYYIIRLLEVEQKHGPKNMGKIKKKVCF